MPFAATRLTTLGSASGLFLPMSKKEVTYGAKRAGIPIKIELTHENATGLAWAVELTGLSTNEIVNLLLTDELSNFRSDNDDSYPHETIGNWKFKDRASAERTLKWVITRVRRGSRAKFPIIESEITELGDGRFEIDAFITRRNGEYDRVC